jgi:hypothetical protein
MAMILAVLLACNVNAAEVTLFKGEPIRLTGITVGGWGSGSAVEGSDRVFTGTRCITITSQGMHEGARIDFKNPVELLVSPFDENTYLEFVFGFTTILRENFGRYLDAGYSFYLPLDQLFSDSGMALDVISRPTIRAIRIVLESSDGRTVEATVGVPWVESDGWYRVDVPYKALGFTKQGESFKVSRITIGTDTNDTIYLGQIATVQDENPIRVDPGLDQIVAVGDTVYFRAEIEGGCSSLRCSWNFGDRDPEGDDAFGDTVAHMFRKGGDFSVKVTVADMNGIKETVVKTLQVQVND